MEPRLEGDSFESNASEVFPFQQPEGPSEINSESEGEESIESLPPPISNTPHRRLTLLAPAERDRFEDAWKPSILLQRYK
jgi:hypothetical protein